MENSRFKLRAYNKKTKQVEEVKEIAFFKDDFVLNTRDLKTLKMQDQINSSEAVLLQFTGLKDKNGVEIYEGDIVKHSVHAVSEPILKQILYFEGSFIAKPSYDSIQSYMSLINFAPCRTMEIIGNIYMNSELLK